MSDNFNKLLIAFKKYNNRLDLILNKIDRVCPKIVFTEKEIEKHKKYVDEVTTWRIENNKK